MKNTLKIFAIALTLLSFGGVSIAQDKKTDNMQKSSDKAMDQKMDTKAQKSKAMTATGEVTSVDPKSAKLTVKANDKDLDLTADSKSAKSALEKVKVGDTVRVTYSDKDGKMVATKVAAVKGSTKKSDTAMDKSKAMDKPEKKADEKKATK
jgi:Cu/Ag efflux protein CusF